MQYDNGYIKLYRKIKYQDWYKKIPERIVFEHCLLSANWEDKIVNDTLIEKGSFITSLNKLVEETGLTKKQIRSALGALERAQMVAQQKTHRFTKITVINWDKYQPPDNLWAQSSAQLRAQKRALTKEDKETKEKRKIEDINNICNQIGFNYLSDDQFRQVQEIWLKNYSIGAIRDFVQIAKQHNAKNLFAYVNTMIHRTLEPASRFDVDKNKKELVDYNWWEEEE